MNGVLFEVKYIERYQVSRKWSPRISAIQHFAPETYQ